MKDYPEFKYHATKNDVKKSELKLTKEIENTKKEIKELDLKLTKEIKESRFSMLKWQFIFFVTQIGAIIAIFYRLADNFSVFLYLKFL